MKNHKILITKTNTGKSKPNCIHYKHEAYDDWGNRILLEAIKMHKTSRMPSIKLTPD